MKRVSCVVGIVAVLAVGSIQAEEVVKKPWKNMTEISAVSSNGNTKASSASGKNAFNYDWTKTSLELVGSALGASDRGRTTAEQYAASEKLSRKFSEKNYVYEKGAWDKDRFSGIKNRWDGSAGLGRDLIKTEAFLWIAELGSGYISEERYHQKRNNFASGRAYTKLSYTISPTSTFSQDAEYLANYEDPDGFRVNTETSLTASISAHFALKVGYKWKHMGQPALGFSRNDTTSIVALVATY